MEVECFFLTISLQKQNGYNLFILFLPGYRGHPTGVRQLLALQSLGGWGIPVRPPPREILPQGGQETPPPLFRWEVQRSSARHKSKQPQKQPRWRQRRGGAQRTSSQKGQEDVLRTYKTKQSFGAHNSLSKDRYFSQPLTLLRRPDLISRYLFKCMSKMNCKFVKSVA